MAYQGKIETLIDSVHVPPPAADRERLIWQGTGFLKRELPRLPQIEGRKWFGLRKAI